MRTPRPAVGGIIPARAGFTPLGGGAPSGPADHPRSRGVYLCFVRTFVRSTGSSPLARGLRGGEGHGGHGVRIIPARAGFTHAVLGQVVHDQDHPRSRGVYCTGRGPAPRHPGSSPLARGLPPSRRGRCGCERIIPARAGFTAPPPPSGAAGQDHPRSRGVYQSLWDLLSRGDGSSPLARGLHLPRRGGGHVGGIIPARAGFTSSRSPVPARIWDHPRSRGVYKWPAQNGPGAPGSSPLARGLHGPIARQWADERIIPARAGFTGTHSGRLSRELDHPRSRGVYARTEGLDPRPPGSSPLARGLRRTGRRPGAARRIIPARAGFTRRPFHRIRIHTDHPRSRGVYQSPVRFIYFCIGSSPLARGLQPRKIEPRRDELDHPRSRGVYVRRG